MPAVFLLGAYWLADSRSPDGGGESHHFTETETQVPAACQPQPQPQQPHIIKLISQLQKPTRRITDTWIIDTGKRETRYQLVEVHQTIRQPHILQFSNSSNLPHYPWILQFIFLTPFVSNLSFPCIVLWSITEIKNLVTHSTSPLFLLHSLIWQNWRVVKYNSNYPCEWMWLEKIHKMLTTDKK